MQIIECKGQAPPPSFFENYVDFFSENARKKNFIKVQNLHHKFFD